MADPADYPTGQWRPMQVGQVTMGSWPVTLSVVEAGDVPVPSGRLRICDPFIFLTDRECNGVLRVRPGTYPVRLTMAEITQPDGQIDPRVAFLSLLLRPEPGERLVYVSPEGVPGELSDGDCLAVPVDGASVCFVDDAAALALGEADELQLYDPYEGTGPLERLNEETSPGFIRALLPRALRSEALIASRSGLGDGVYPVIASLTGTGDVAAIHVDFYMFEALSPSED